MGGPERREDVRSIRPRCQHQPRVESCAGSGARNGCSAVKSWPPVRILSASMITVRMVKCSVSAGFIGPRLRVCQRASEVVVSDGRAAVARQRIVADGGQSAQLDHYLEVLKIKRSALPGSTALARAQEPGALASAPHVTANWRTQTREILRAPRTTRGKHRRCTSSAVVDCIGEFSC